ncbi:unnamed protein product [Zymoseptoria tritici ST99CH_3D7]|uniref:Pre-mRNA splicing factor CLF1 n=1 Tax=Zymoseptoria tritici (strain ST99CH_3D7) TaxID=1276538 RepID=A0A1X7RFU2_ZYMT9|nr:unnamed protein product [Zymoseptoria tritici ST99CH_3D7]
MEHSGDGLKALGGRCSAIHKDILYLFTGSKLLSLPLERNATVSEEALPESASGPACVKVSQGGDDVLYVIGGDDTSDEYSGLQRYSFGNDRWDTLSPPVDVLRTRTNHSVAYLQDTDEILIYAGSTVAAPSLLSSQTFLLSTKPPYNIRSFTSKAPPATRPILQPWNSSHAVMVGGESTNTGVWLFGPEQGWSKFETSLTDPLNANAQGILITGTDGSKVLQVYETSQSPNAVRNIVLQGAFGVPAAPGTTVGGGSSPSSRKRKRDLTLNDWPAYNKTNAPTSTRTDYSLAQRADGLVVMAGGNEQEPIIMYDRERNSWVDTDDIFGQQPLIPTSTPSATTSATRTSTPSASTSAAAKEAGAAENEDHDRTMRTLGITLGVLCGIGALFILILLWLRWRKLKAKKQEGYLQEKDGADQNRMSFADRGASFMKEAGMSADDLSGYDRPWNPSAKQNAHSSLAIMTGKYGKFKANNHAPKASFESTAQLVKNKNGNMLPSDNLEMMDIGDKSFNGSTTSLAVPGAAVLNGNSLDKEVRAERSRSSGWSKYFATTAPNGPNGLSHIPSAYIKPGTSPIPESEYSSDERDRVSRIPSSVMVAPLDIDFKKTVDGQRLSHVAARSPALFARRSSTDIYEGQQGLIVDPNDPHRSHATSISSYGNRSTMDSTATSEFCNESGQTLWTPMSGNPPMPGNSTAHAQNMDRDRRTSSVYTANPYDIESRRPSRGKSAGFFPGTGVGYAKPSKVKLSHNASPTADWAAPPRAPFAAKPAGEIRDSTSSIVTIFPGVPSSYYEDKTKADTHPGAEDTQPRNTDLSWLNLDASKPPTPN